MNKQTIAVIVIVLAGGLAVWRFATHSPYDTRKLDEISYAFKCHDCGATFDYTTSQMKDFVKQGKFEEVPMQARKFPCPKCGKISGLISVGSYDEQNQPTR